MANDQTPSSRYARHTAVTPTQGRANARIADDQRPTARLLLTRNRGSRGRGDFFEQRNGLLFIQHSTP